MKLPVKSGLDYIRGKDWKPLIRTRKGAEKLGQDRMPADLKRCGFHTVVAQCSGYFRISYGK